MDATRQIQQELEFFVFVHMTGEKRDPFLFFAVVIVNRKCGKSLKLYRCLLGWDHKSAQLAQLFLCSVRSEREKGKMAFFLVFFLPSGRERKRERREERESGTKGNQ